MIISKLIGGVLITVCALKIYAEIQKFQKKSIKQIDSFIELIDYIKNQIECFLLPIDTIMFNCDNKLLLNCGIQRDMEWTWEGGRNELLIDGNSSNAQRDFRPLSRESVC